MGEALQRSSEIKWESSVEDLETIKKLAESEDKLDRAYAEAYQNAVSSLNFVKRGLAESPRLESLIL